MKDWKSVVGAVAPALATALGGPLAGVAVRAISEKVLGRPEAGESDVAAAIAGATPETLVKLRELDQEFAKHMANLGVELEKLGTEDRANARAREVAARDWTTRVLAIAIVTLFALVLVAMVSFPIPTPNRDAANLVLGILSGAVGSVVGYYFGSSSGSRAKDEILGRVAQK